MNSLIIGLISFVVAIFLFSFSLPLMRELINNTLPFLGSASSFFVLIIPFSVFFLLIFSLFRIMAGGEA